MHAIDLKAARSRLKMTQVELANALGMSVVTVQRYEQGINEIPKYIELAITALGGKPYSLILIPLAGAARECTAEEIERVPLYIHHSIPSLRTAIYVELPNAPQLPAGARIVPHY